MSESVLKWKLDATKNYKLTALTEHFNNAFHIRATHHQNNRSNCCNRNRSFLLDFSRFVLFSLITYFCFVYHFLLFLRIDFVFCGMGVRMWCSLHIVSIDLKCCVRNVNIALNCSFIFFFSRSRMLSQNKREEVIKFQKEKKSFYQNSD